MSEERLQRWTDVDLKRVGGKETTAGGFYRAVLVREGGGCSIRGRRRRDSVRPRAQRRHGLEAHGPHGRRLIPASSRATQDIRSPKIDRSASALVYSKIHLDSIK